MKKILSMGALLLGAGMMLVACGSDSEPATFSVEDSFEILLSKSNYSYKSKDSSLVVKAPVCKEVKQGNLAYLEWEKETSKPESFKAYRKDSKAFLRAGKESDSDVYSYDGNSFPKGAWVDVDVVKNSIRYAKRFTSDMVKEVFQYDGSCLMKSFYSQLFKNNDALFHAEEVLSSFYMMFDPDGDAEFDEEDLLDTLRVPTCDEITLFDGDVSVKVDELKESSGSLSVRYKQKSCYVSFEIRYANNESDCRAAYDEYKLNNFADKPFDFYDFAETVDYSYNCVSELVQEIQKDKGIVAKKVRNGAEDEASVSKFTRSLVKMFIGR